MDPSLHPPEKGILKRVAQSTSSTYLPHTKIRWDEDNLIMNESQRGHCMKITEPKTPFIHYDYEKDLILGQSAAIPPLELSAALQSTHLGSSQSSLETEFGMENQEDSQHASSSSSSSVVVVEQEWSDDEEEEELDEQALQLKREFDESRHQHYNMKNALQRGRYLVEHDDEEEDDAPDANEGQPDSDGQENVQEDPDGMEWEDV